MSEKFEVGEVVVTSATTPRWPPIGTEFTVAEIRPSTQRCGGLDYVLEPRWNGLKLIGCTCCLRKRRPPQDWEKLAAIHYDKRGVDLLTEMFMEALES